MTETADKAATTASEERRAPDGRAWFAVAAGLFVAAVGWTVFAALSGSNLANARDDVPLGIFFLAGLVSLSGWWRERAERRAREVEQARERERLNGRVSELEGSRARAERRAKAEREEAGEARRERERFAAKVRELEKNLGRERYLRSRSEDAHRKAESWRRQLHEETMRLYGERGGALSDPSDVPSMVLHLVRTMVEAEKGLLLSREADGLKLAASEGFEGDPSTSGLVRRFAGEVLERDRALREESPEGEGPADGEIRNLVAVPIYLRDEFDGVVVCANNPNGFADYDDEVLLAVGDQAGAVLQNTRLQGDLRRAYLSTVRVLAEAIEAKDPSLRGHSDDVSGYVAAVADHFGLSPERREALVFGSLLHDVGKIGISERILLKPAALSPKERKTVELHSRIGYHLVRQVPALRAAAPAVLYHHERYDGKGYPSGLRAEQIPLEARIICVADSFSAMITDRPYRRAMSVEAALAELERCAGAQFDPEVVGVFLEQVRRNPPLSRKEDPISSGDPALEDLFGAREPVLGHDALSVTDNLTMLYARRYLHEAAAAEARRSALQGRPFGVVFVELCGVAATNEREGYAAGDRQIRRAARVVEEVALERGGTACRSGGVRFAVLLPGADEAAAQEVLAGVREALRRTLPDPPATRAAAASWLPGESGEGVLARARARLETSPPS